MTPQRREDVFTRAHRVEMLKKFNAKAKQLFLADLTNEELEVLVMEMHMDLTNVAFGRGFEKAKRGKK